MSKIIATKTYLIATVLGNIAVRNDLVSGYDVEDIVHEKAESQARAIQMMNIGKDLKSNPNLPAEALPSVFANNDSEDLV